jgi:molecular chaperone GrpE
MSQQDEQPPRVVIRDKRRIDPTSGAVRVPAGNQPAGTAPEQGEQMSEHDSETAPPIAEESVDGGPDDATRQLAERTEDLQRVTAEYANYRRRVERDRAVAAEQATAAVLTALLPVLDDIDRARTHGDLTGAFAAVAEQLASGLQRIGLAPFGEPGDAFDPVWHEAVLHTESPDVTQPTCVDVMRRGYALGERMLRPAMVAVADPTAAPSGSAEAAPAPSE